MKKLLSCTLILCMLISCIQGITMSVCASASDIESSIVDGYVTGSNGYKYLLEDLNFAKTSDADGNPITYESSDETVVKSDGTLVRANVDKAVAVTVTEKVEASGIPDDITSIYTDDFENGSIDEKINQWNLIETDDVVESDGILKFIRPVDSYDEARIDFSPNTENTGVTGKLLIKFTVEKDMDHMRVELRDNNSTGGTGRLVKIQWERDNFRLASKVNGATKWTSHPLASGTDKIDVAVYADMSSGTTTFTIWVDETLVIANTSPLDTNFDSTKGVNCVRMYTLNDNVSYTSVGSYSIDNFGFYTVNSLPEAGKLVDKKTIFNYIVPGKYNKIGLNDMPAVGKVEYKNSFDAEEAFSNVNSIDPEKGDYIRQNTQDGNLEMNIKSAGLTNTGISLNSGLLYSTGVVVHEVIFETTCTQVRFETMDNTPARACLVLYVNGYFYDATGRKSTGEYPLGSKLKLSMVTDFSTNTVDLYINGNLELENISNARVVSPMHIKHQYTTNWQGIATYSTGVTKIYSYKIYRPADETTSLPSIMATDIDNETGKISIVATDDTCKGMGTFVYAAYSSDYKELLGISLVDLTLDKFSHREYTAEIKTDLPTDAKYKCFYFDSRDCITPLTVKSFPTN